MKVAVYWCRTAEISPKSPIYCYRDSAPATVEFSMVLFYLNNPS